ncbi:MAG: zinc-finger domain-containing protein [Gammaproteobacteria bacterium]|nr:zinc-finger domain-containing protein [Gammaproteobacteria bacterium]
MRDRLKRLNTEPHYTITTQDLPLCCPGKNMTIVDAHPRVFLSLGKDGEASCPYCSAKYTLIRSEKNNG